MNKWLMSAVLILSSFTIHAEKMAFNIGKIISINAKVINFDDRSFLMSPTVKVLTKNNKKIPLSTLKVGDYVVLSMIKIGKKKLVDQIQMSPFGKVRLK